MELLTVLLIFGGIVDHHCLEVIVRFVYIGGIVDHHCLEVSSVFYLLTITV